MHRWSLRYNWLSITISDSCCRWAMYKRRAAAGSNFRLPFFVPISIRPRPHSGKSISRRQKRARQEASTIPENMYRALSLSRPFRWPCEQRRWKTQTKLRWFRQLRETMTCLRFWQKTHRTFHAALQLPGQWPDNAWPINSFEASTIEQELNRPTVYALRKEIT